jgi:uncharacterized protein YoxC
MANASDEEPDYAACERQMDQSMARLQKAVKKLESKAQSVDALREERKLLLADRDKLASDLKRETRRAGRLDDAAADVSRRLIETMETVKTVLAK